MKTGFGHSPGKVLSVLAMLGLHAATVCAQQIPPDEGQIRWPEPEAASRFRRPVGPAPVTVATLTDECPERFISLDEAIRLALAHSEVIRVLGGVSASSSGRTIYDTAIAVTPIDVAKARFDPVFQANTSFRRTEIPFLNPAGTSIAGAATAGNDSGIGVRDLNRYGGTASILSNNRFDTENGAGFLTRDQPSLEVSYTQPILAGAGRRANEAPIVVARLQQQQSYFQFKNSFQGLVRDTIQAYWLLVQARTELWAREIQVEQLQFSKDKAQAEKDVGRRDGSFAAQAQASLANARATLVQSRANVLQREAALRNLIGLPPEDGDRIVPSTPPTRDRIEFRWDEIVDTAQSRRPDLIELNLILSADQQSLIQRKNLAKPSLDAVAVHRWNGLTGNTIATGNHVDTGFDNHTDWTLGINFSVPLTLRESRARVRNQELLIARDRANIQQSLHQIEHLLAGSMRTIEQNLQQYEAFREARQASAFNVLVQRGKIEAQRETLLSELLAITDWANAVAAEAQALTAYNTELANLELQSGTILETHGIRFIEERFASFGPHGWCNEELFCYPRDLRPEENAERYEDLQKPSEEAFELKDFEDHIRRSREQIDEQPALPPLQESSILPPDTDTNQ